MATILVQIRLNCLLSKIKSIQSSDPNPRDCLSLPPKTCLVYDLRDIGPQHARKIAINVRT